MTAKEVLQEIEGLKPNIPWQTYNTLKGQVRAGDISGAALGVERLKRKLKREEEAHANCSR